MNRLADLAIPGTDRPLDLGDFLNALVAQGRISQDSADHLVTLRRAAVGDTAKLHPLEFIAGQNVDDLARPGKKLDLDSLSRWLASESDQPWYRIDPLKINVSAVTPLMSFAFAQRHRILAVEVNDREVTIASAQPFVQSWEDNLRHVLKRDIRRVIANPEDLQRYSVEFYRLARSVTGANATDQKASGVGNFEQLLNLGSMSQEPDANDAHVVNIVDWLFQYAFEQRASDIHIEPRRDSGCVRLRIDGVLHTVYQFPIQVTMAVVSRLKTLGRMNVAEKRKPQDGRIKTRAPKGNEVELRLSTLPTAFGEKMVMRIFDPSVLLKSFEQLGLGSEDFHQWESMVSNPSGIVLVTGPTGSGKTTTLYTSLKHLANEDVNVCTIEDPIEYDMGRGINQVQLNRAKGQTFVSILRTFLRQDPDVILIGETRDPETAECSMDAAETGHLVFTTLHANSSTTSLTRLLDMEVPKYKLNSSVRGVLAQRLLRKVCTGCGIKRPVSESESIRFGIEEGTHVMYSNSLSSEEKFKRQKENSLCQKCRGTGYKGRIGVYELLEVKRNIQNAISKGLTDSEIENVAVNENSMLTLSQYGIELVKEQLTTISEVIRVCKSD